MTNRVRVHQTHRRTTATLPLAVVLGSMSLGANCGAPPRSRSPGRATRVSAAQPTAHTLRPPAHRSAADTPTAIGRGLPSAALTTLQRLPLLVAPRTPQRPAPGQVTVAILFASWCGHCHATLADLARLRATTDIAVLGLSWSPFEGYDGMGDAERLAAFTITTAPWMPVHELDASTYAALGRPTKVPSMFVYDAQGHLVRVFDRAHEGVPTRDELTAAIKHAQLP